MKRKPMLACFAAVMLAASGAMAGGKILATAPAQRTFPVPQTMYCDIVSIDSVPRNVTIEGMDATGAVVDGPYMTTLGPGTGDYLYLNSVNASWCRFTVTGSTKTLRAMSVYDDGNHYVISLPAE